MPVPYLHVGSFTLSILLLLSYSNSFCQHGAGAAADAKLSGDYVTDTALINNLNRAANENFSVDLQKLHAYSHRAAALAKRLHYSKGEATAYQHIALSYMLIHGDITALDYLRKALTLFQIQKDTIDIARTINYIGCYYATVKDFRQALPFFQQSEKIVGDRKDKVLLTIWSNTGSCYEDLGQYDNAAFYYQKVKNLAYQVNDYSWIVTSLYQQASIYFLKGESDRARQLITKALSTAHTHNVSARDIMSLHMLAGNVYYNQKLYILSRQHFDTASSLAKKMNSREGMSEIYEKAYLLDSATGNYKGAMTNLRLHKLMNDALINERKNQLATLFRIKYELNQEEMENKNLLSEKEIQSDVILYQRLLLVVAIVLLLVAVYAAFTLRRKNSKLGELNNRIEIQNEELSKLNEVKNRLFSVVAHDIRSPFAQLISLLDMIDSRMIGPEEISDLLPHINKSASKTMSMMDNLLVWSRSQMDGFIVHSSFVELYDLIADKVVNVQAQLENKRIKVINRVATGHKAWADKEMLRVVIRNLLANAIKFTPAGGTITFSSELDDESIVLAVSDSGVGIPQEKLVKLFSFETESTPGTQQESGTGIGLQICKELVDLNKGSISVQSRPGEGSTFFVRLPLLAKTED